MLLPFLWKGGWSYPEQTKATSYLASLAFSSGQTLRANFVIEFCRMRVVSQTALWWRSSTQETAWRSVPDGNGVSTASHLLQSECSYWQTCWFVSFGKGPKTLGIVILGGSGALERKGLNPPPRVCIFPHECLVCRPFLVFAPVWRKKIFQISTKLLVSSVYSFKTQCLGRTDGVFLSHNLS